MNAVVRVALLVMAFAAACYWPLRLAWADVLHRRGDTARAIRLAPGNAEYRLRAGDPAAAVRLNPWLAPAWIELGLAAERRGDLPDAERNFREACRADRTYQPLWTLANYYARRGDRARFWESARRALEIGVCRGSYDASALYALSRRMAGDPAEVLARAVPDCGPALRSYLAFLVRAGYADAATAAAEKLLDRAAGDADVSALLDYCDWSLARGRSPLRIWNALCRRRRLPFAPLGPEPGLRLTNADFSVPAIGRGFDWRFNSIPAISLQQTTAGLRVAFSGREPEAWEILSQYVPVLGVDRLRLRSSGALPAGVFWRVTGGTLGGDGRIRVDAGAEVLRLALAYQRAPGTTRFEGAVSIRRVSLDVE